MVCPSVASRNPFVPFLDPVHVLHISSLWLSWTPYEDPRWSCGNILKNSLLIPCFTVDRPSHILRSIFTSVPEYPVRRRGSLHFWHYALDHFFSKNTGLVAKQGDWQHTNTYPISMVRFLRFLSSPSSLCQRLPSTSTDVWVPLFSSAHISTGSFFSLDSVMSPPAFYDFHVYIPSFGCRSGSGTAFFLYLTIFLICSASSVCPFASSPSCSHEACHLANRLFFLHHISCHSCAVPVVPISC